MRGHGIWDGVELYEGGAALLTDESVLVVADLHLGCEAALEYEGLSIPRVQTRKIEKYLHGIIDGIGPDRLVFAGDLKHNFSRNLTQEWQDVSRFIREVQRKVSIEVVKGNHDNYLGAILAEYGVPLRKETCACGYRILHGHSGMQKGGPLIFGHIHPSIRITDSVGVSVKDHCFLCSKEMQVLILPALSVVSPGMDVVGNEYSDRSSPLLPSSGLSEFVPVVFTKEKALEFPTVGSLRRTQG